MLLILLLLGILKTSVGYECDDFLSSDQQLKLKLGNDGDGFNNYLLVKCNYEESKSFLHLLPNCTYASVDTVRFQECSFSNLSIDTALNSLGILPEKLVALTLANPRDLVEISSTFLGVLPNLMDFFLYSGNVAKIRSRSFVNCPNLRMLLISGNRFSFLPVDTFYGLPNLKILSLENNRLSSLPDSLFESLPALSRLILLSNNLSSLSPIIFSNLTELESISLQRNNLNRLSPDLFKNNILLDSINLRRNNLQTIPSELFSNLTKLNRLVLSDNNLTSISPTLFDWANNITELDLSRNSLNSLETDTFTDLRNLSKLNLSRNRLQSLPSELLKENGKLLDLNLGSNKISHIDALFFETLFKLEHLDLTGNVLSTIGIGLFKNCKSLKTVVLKYNNISSIQDASSFPRSIESIYLSHNALTDMYSARTHLFLFSNNVNLNILDVSHNNITVFPEVWTLMQLKKFDLSYNQITSISWSSINNLARKVFLDLSHNYISVIQVSPFLANDIEIKLDISNNPFSCDCRLVPFTQYLQTSQFPSLDLMNSPETQCQEPQSLKNTTLVKVDFKELMCHLPAPSKQCSQLCDCTIHEFYKKISVDCSNKSLSSVPAILHKRPYKYSYNLSNNYLQNFNFSEEDDRFLRELDISHNELTDNSVSNMTHLPAKLEKIDLSYNAFQHLSQEFLETINRTDLRMDLSGNEWICDCSLNFLHDHVQANFKKILNVRNIICKGYSQPLIDMRNDEVCYSATYWTMITAGPILAFTVAVVVTVLLIHYKMTILVWMYSHQLCLGLITEEEVDSDKTYDAFISYSHEDEDFVRNELVPQLEEEDPKYKLCIHWRDWIGGELIQTQILKSVKNSRRTLVVLSENFVGSSWGQDEFRSAHQQALQDKTNRVILIVYGEIPKDEVLGDELRHYIRSHTYIKWGNPKFWDQLRFAMPHRKQFTKKKQPTPESIKMDSV